MFDSQYVTFYVFHLLVGDKLSPTNIQKDLEALLQGLSFAEAEEARTQKQPQEILKERHLSPLRFFGLDSGLDFLY